MAKITLYGLEAYMQQNGESLFTSLTLPTGYDKETFVDNLIRMSGEFSLIYSDPDFVKDAIKKWGLLHYKTFEKWLAAWNAEYNPIHNFDRYEESDDNATGITNENSISNTSGTSKSGTSASTLSSSNQNNSVSAFDSSDYSPKEQTKGLVNEQASTDADSTTSSSGTDNKKATKLDTNQHKAHLFGNIGVTTNQQMITAEMEMRKRYNPYILMAELFEDEFLIPVYD